jgi:molybdopterin-containing oxidoreductase family membrane subunit
MQATARTLTLGGHVVPIAPRAIGAAVIGEIRSMSVGLRLWFLLLLTVISIAAVAAMIAIPPGWEVFGTSPSFEWGLLIIGYVFFAIMTSGLCLASSLGTVFGIERFRPLEKRHAILALLSLTTAFGIIAIELHYPIRMVFGAVFVPSPSSPMWWMGVFYGTYLVVLLVEVWSMFTDHPKIHQWSCTAASCVAILAPATLGAVFAVLAAKPFWHGPFTVILMVASAFLAGTALLGIVFYVVIRLGLQDLERARRYAVPSIRLLLTIGLVLVAVLVARQVHAGLTGSEYGLREATEALVAGPLAWQFWGLRVALGLVVPLTLVILPWTRTPAGLFAASLLTLTGVFTDRLLFVTAGQIYPVTTVAGTVSYPYATYTPSPVEIAIIAGAVAFLAFAYTLAERYLDLEEADVHTFFPWPGSATRTPRRATASLRRPRTAPRPLPRRSRHDRADDRRAPRVRDRGGAAGAGDRGAGRVPGAGRPAGPHGLLLVRGCRGPHGHAHHLAHAEPQHRHRHVADRDRDGARLRLHGLPCHRHRHRRHEADPGSCAPAVGLPRLHRLPRQQPAGHDGAGPLRAAQGRLPRVPQGARKPRGRHHRRPVAPRAHGRRQGVHGLPRRRQARAAPRLDGRPGQLLDLPQRQGVHVPVRGNAGAAARRHARGLARGLARGARRGAVRALDPLTMAGGLLEPAAVARARTDARAQTDARSQVSTRQMRPSRAERGRKPAARSGSATTAARWTCIRYPDDRRNMTGLASVAAARIHHVSRG